MNQESVASDTVRLSSKDSNKQAFYINVEDALLYEDFPCNPVGVYTMLVISK